MPNSLKRIFLLPGEYAVGDARCEFSTLLGSCVSVTLWHPELRLGAMSHFLLPGANPRGRSPNARYAEDALALMSNDLQALGVRLQDCEAKVFGGGAMFDHPNAKSDVGRKNGEAAKALLRAYQIPIVSESLFDAGHRRILFRVRSGEVWMRHARPAELRQQGLESPSPAPTHRQRLPA